MTAAAESSEVWLRGNPRPAIAGAAVLVAAALAIAVAARQVGATTWPGWTLVGIGLTLVALAAALVVSAARPRLARRADRLLVRLAPLAVHDVPLEIVECVFPGSQSLDEGRDGAARRVGTIVVRLAERAVDWRDRPTFAPWGTWHEGHVVIDGRWCEPLSLEVTRQLGQRILDAKRKAASAAAGGDGR